jgi:hypothetical protein
METYENIIVETGIKKKTTNKVKTYDRPLLFSPIRSIAHAVPTPSYVYWFQPNKGHNAKANVMAAQTEIITIL